MSSVLVKFYLETALAIAASISLGAFLLWPKWIEEILRVEPDGGGGALEASIAVALAAMAVTAILLARGAWQRHVATAS